MFKFLLLSALLFFLFYGIRSFLRQAFTGQQRRPNTNHRQKKQPEKEDKRFTKDVGEYVSYEEIKDDK